MVMLKRWPVMERACLCYIGGQFNKREHGNVTEAGSLMEREWSCYGGGQFNGRGHGRYRGGQYILPLNLLILFINVFIHTGIFLHTGADH